MLPHLGQADRGVGHGLAPRRGFEGVSIGNLETQLQGAHPHHASVPAPAADRGASVAFAIPDDEAATRCRPDRATRPANRQRIARSESGSPDPSPGRQSRLATACRRSRACRRNRIRSGPNHRPRTTIAIASVCRARGSKTSRSHRPARPGANASSIAADQPPHATPCWPRPIGWRAQAATAQPRQPLECHRASDGGPTKATAAGCGLPGPRRSRARQPAVRPADRPRPERHRCNRARPTIR